MCVSVNALFSRCSNAQSCTELMNWAVSVESACAKKLLIFVQMSIVSMFTQYMLSDSEIVVGGWNRWQRDRTKRKINAQATDKKKSRRCRLENCQRCSSAARAHELKTTHANTKRLKLMTTEWFRTLIGSCAVFCLFFSLSFSLFRSLGSSTV